MYSLMYYPPADIIYIISNNPGVGVSISDLEDHKEAGMESLEALQNQLQLLVSAYIHNTIIMEQVM